MNLRRRICFWTICCGALLIHTASAAEKSSARSLQDSYAAAAEKAFPAVVVIENCRHNGRTFVRAGTGSGFLVRSNGYIATNYHVVKGADALAVKLADRQPVPAEIVGTDPDVDLAVIKIPASGKLPYLQFADTSKVKVGHHAIAIGAPFSLANTMTTGIVSHKGRKLGNGYYEDYIQTDASINPGNSGGPLLNISGKVIGVNSCILAPGGANAGIGFAIDGNLAKKRIGAMIAARSKNKPFLGAVVRDTSPPGRGAVITRLVKNSPAEKAGLRPNDIVIKIGSRSTANIYDVQSVVTANCKRGDIAEIFFIRNGKTMKTVVKF